MTTCSPEPRQVLTALDIGSTKCTFFCCTAVFGSGPTPESVSANKPFADMIVRLLAVSGQRVVTLHAHFHPNHDMQRVLRQANMASKTRLFSRWELLEFAL